MLHVPKVALVPWGTVIEDILEPQGLTLEDFAAHYTGSWMFGWVHALRRAGIETSLICVSRRATAPVRLRHAPSGAGIVVVPASGAYRRLSRHIADPYGRNVAETFGPTAARSPLIRLAPSLTREAAPYLSVSPLALARAIRREGCSAIICQEYEFPRFDVCVLAGRLERMPAFASFQGGDYQRWRVERLLRPLSMRAAAGVLVGPAREAERVGRRYGLPAAKVTRVPNPVDVDVWRPRDRTTARARLGLPEQARVVAWHGRVELRKKGLDVLIAAWERLVERREEPPWLLLVGDGPDGRELDRLLEATSSRHVVRVREHVHDAATLSGHLAAADLYAFPSRHEGFPVAPVEALACGLPLVAADVGGVADILGDVDPPGVIVAREDAAGLGRELDRLLDDEPRRVALALRARERAVSAFSLDAVGARLRGVLGVT